MGFNCNWNCNNCNQISVKIEIEPGQRKRRRDNHSNRLEQLAAMEWNATQYSPRPTFDNTASISKGVLRRPLEAELAAGHCHFDQRRRLEAMQSSNQIESNPLYSGWGSSKGLE
jgi:hypothetical protein